MTSNIASRIIYELSETKEGLAPSEILKNINDKNIRLQHLNYYLKELVKSNILKKEDNKYILIKKTFMANGSAVVEFQDKLLILECPYFGSGCRRCHNGELKGKCLFVEGLPESLKSLFENAITHTGT